MCIRLAALWLLSVLASAQTLTTTATNPTSAVDVQATALMQKATVAQMGANVVQDVQITGSVTFHAGTDSHGQITLTADSTGRSKVVLNLDSGNRTEVSSGRIEAPACTWTDAQGTTHNAATHNCSADASWFFPVLNLALGQQQGTNVVSYIGSEQRNEVAVQHLASQRIITGQDATMTAQLQQLSNQDLYLDSATNLPVSLVYFAHPDNDLKVNIPIEVKFSDYRDVNGVKVPFHIEKLMNGSKLLEIAVEFATFNTGASTK